MHDGSTLPRTGLLTGVLTGTTHDGLKYASQPASPLARVKAQLPTTQSGSAGCTHQIN